MRMRARGLGLCRTVAEAVSYKTYDRHFFSSFLLSVDFQIQIE